MPAVQTAGAGETVGKNAALELGIGSGGSAASA
jgi:hypothetical protein